MMSSSTSLVWQLNDLLASLNLPFVLESPIDLTPSLLLTILESLLGSRIPLAFELREALVPQPTSRTPTSAFRHYAAQIQMIKIFLGVLESDFLQMDVGLSSIDPRKLARGSWDETVFIGELLAWIGRRRSGEQQTDRVQEARPPRSSAIHLDQTPHWRAGSPTGTVTTMTTKLTDLTTDNEGPSRWKNALGLGSDSNTSFAGSLVRFDGEDTPDQNQYQHRNQNLPFIGEDEAMEDEARYSPHLPGAPRCIHEVPTPSFLLSPVSLSDPNWTEERYPIDDSFRLDSEVPVRYSGYIDVVDEISEIDIFEASRSRHPSSHQEVEPSPKAPKIKSFRSNSKSMSPQALRSRTFSLLQERARLLTELAEIGSVSDS